MPVWVLVVLDCRCCLVLKVTPRASCVFLKGLTIELHSDPICRF